MSNTTSVGDASIGRPNDVPDAISVAAAAKLASIGRSTLYKALTGQDGLPPLPSVKLGKRRLIRRDALRAWLKAAEHG